MAASALKIAANRANVTQTIIPGESQEQYERFAAGMRKDLAPGSAIENVLADRVIAAAWRLQRFTRVESAFLANRIDAYLEAHPESDPDVAMANLFIDPAEIAKMRLFMRYQTATQREYDKAFKEFQAAKNERRKQQMQTLALESYEPIGFASQEPAQPRVQPVISNIGFASQQRGAQL